MISLYEQIGGDALFTVVTEFYNRLFSDPMICFLFAGKDKQRLIQKEWEFTAEMLGGSVRYTGRTLKSAHAYSLILEGHFYRRLHILEQTLIDHNVPAPVREAWIGHTWKLQPQIKYAIIRTLLPKQFELFIGTPQQREVWKRQGMDRALRNIWDWVLWKSSQAADHTATDIERQFNIMVKQVTEQLLSFQFETAVTAMVEFSDYILHPDQASKPVSRDTLRSLVVVLTAFAPRMTGALWELMGELGCVYDQPYPKYDATVN